MIKIIPFRPDVHLTTRRWCPNLYQIFYVNFQNKKNNLFWARTRKKNTSIRNAVRFEAVTIADGTRPTFKYCQCVLWLHLITGINRHAIVRVVEVNSKTPQIHRTRVTCKNPDVAFQELTLIASEGSPDREDTAGRLTEQNPECCLLLNKSY